MKNEYKFDVLVVGSGGNGQTYFMNFLNENNITTNHIGDRDGLKHLSSPKLLKSLNISFKKCIFIYNDSLTSILSHFRRKWAYIQSNKLINTNSNLLNNKFNDKLNKLCEKSKMININYNSCYKFSNIKSFEDIVKKYKIDLFGIEYQFNN